MVTSRTPFRLLERNKVLTLDLVQSLCRLQPLRLVLGKQLSVGLQLVLDQLRFIEQTQAKDRPSWESRRTAVDRARARRA